MAASLFWIGLICVVIGLISSPSKDGRFSSGFKDNKTETSSDNWFSWGIILWIAAGLIAWFF